MPTRKSRKIIDTKVYYYFGNLGCLSTIRRRETHPSCGVDSCGGKRLLHGFTFTSPRFQHGAMLFLWWKSRTPHRNGFSGAIYRRIATFLSSNRVVCRKPPPPHKEHRTKNSLFIREGVYGRVEQQNAIIVHFFYFYNSGLTGFW